MRDPADSGPSTADALFGVPASGTRSIRAAPDDCRREPGSSHEVRFARESKLCLLPGGVQRSSNDAHRASAASAGEDYSLLVNLGASYRIAQHGRELVLGEGEGTLIAGAVPSTAAGHPPADVLALRIPREQLARLVPRVKTCLMRVIPRDIFALRLLRDYVGIAWQDGVAGRGELPELAIGHIHDLVAVALSVPQDGEASPQTGAPRAGRFAAIKQDIAQHLAEGDLSIGALAMRHGCTPRFVQRLFENEGTTFTEYVLAQRLACAHGMLSDPSRADEKIAGIAYEAGFSDLSYFNRVFRRHYGVAPSAVRAGTREDATGRLMISPLAASLALAAELSGALDRLPP